MLGSIAGVLSVLHALGRHMRLTALLVGKRRWCKVIRIARDGTVQNLHLQPISKHRRSRGYGAKRMVGCLMGVALFDRARVVRWDTRGYVNVPTAIAFF
jgi:hypothetical protein